MNSLGDFVSRYCEGKQYDSCVESPCRFSSHSGCRHPMHPNNKEQEMVELKKDTYYWSKCLEDWVKYCGIQVYENVPYHNFFRAGLGLFYWLDVNDVSLMNPITQEKYNERIRPSF